jgi:hypothetical protein
VIPSEGISASDDYIEILEDLKTEKGISSDEAANRSDATRGNLKCSEEDFLL